MGGVLYSPTIKEKREGSKLVIRLGIPEGQRSQMAEMLVNIFKEKFTKIFGQRTDLILFLSRSFYDPRTLVAVHKEKAVGVTGLAFDGSIYNECHESTSSDPGDTGMNSISSRVRVYATQFAAFMVGESMCRSPSILFPSPSSFFCLFIRNSGGAKGRPYSAFVYLLRGVMGFPVFSGGGAFHLPAV